MEDGHNCFGVKDLEPSLLPSDTIEIFISSGQSWRVGSGLARSIGLCDLGEPDAIAFRFKGSEKFAVPSGQEWIGDRVADFKNLSVVTEIENISPTGFITIGWVAAQVYCALGKAANVERRNVLDYCHGIGGQTWQGLKPGGVYQHFDGVKVSDLANGDRVWDGGLILHKKAVSISAEYGKRANFLAVGWTHGAYRDDHPDTAGIHDYYQVLAEMVTAYDDLNLCGEGQSLKYFIDQTCALSVSTKTSRNALRQLDFCDDNPGKV